MSRVAVEALGSWTKKTEQEERSGYFFVPRNSSSCSTTMEPTWCFYCGCMSNWTCQPDRAIRWPIVAPRPRHPPHNIGRYRRAATGKRRGHCQHSSHRLPRIVFFLVSSSQDWDAIGRQQRPHAADMADRREKLPAPAVSSSFWARPTQEPTMKWKERVGVSLAVSLVLVTSVLVLDIRLAQIRSDRRVQAPNSKEASSWPADGAGAGGGGGAVDPAFHGRSRQKVSSLQYFVQVHIQRISKPSRDVLLFFYGAAAGFSRGSKKVSMGFYWIEIFGFWFMQYLMGLYWAPVGWAGSPVSTSICGLQNRDGSHIGMQNCLSQFPHRDSFVLKAKCWFRIRFVKKKLDRRDRNSLPVMKRSKKASPNRLWEKNFLIGWDWRWRNKFNVRHFQLVDLLMSESDSFRQLMLKKKRNSGTLNDEFFVSYQPSLGRFFLEYGGASRCPLMSSSIPMSVKKFDLTCEQIELRTRSPKKSKCFTVLHHSFFALVTSSLIQLCSFMWPMIELHALLWTPWGDGFSGRWLAAELSMAKKESRIGFQEQALPFPLHPLSQSPANVGFQLLNNK